MSSGVRPFFRGKSFTKSGDQRVDVHIPLPRDDRPSWGRRPSNPSSLRTSVGTTTAADLVTQSRGDTSETQVVHEPFAEEVRNDLSKLPDMEVFPATTDMAVSPATTDGMLSPAAERVQDGNDRSFVYTSPHADDRAIALPFSPTPKHVGLHGMDGAEVSRVSSFNVDSPIADEQHASKVLESKDKDPMSHQPCQQGDASPRPRSSMGGAQSRRANLPLPARPGSSASPRRKSFSVNDADSAARGPKVSESPKKKYSTMHDVELDTMGMASTEVRCLKRQVEVPPSSNDDLPVQRTRPLSARRFSTDPTPADDLPGQRTPALSGGGRPPSQSAPSRPGFKKAATFSEITSAGTGQSGQGGQGRSSPKGEGNGRARRLSLIPAGQLQRQLSFADESLDQLSANIFTEVEIFNRWQAMGSWSLGLRFMDAYELQELLSVPMPKTLAWVKLFDPAAYAQHASTRLGMFDENDSRMLNSAEFVEMPSLRRKLGKCLFDRVVNSAKKIKAKDAAPIWLIEEWFLSEGGDPLAAPFAMLLERFSVREFEDDPEFFEDEDKSFKLSHTAPVELPLQTAAALAQRCFNFCDAGLVRKVFCECEKQRDFSLSYEDMGRHVVARTAAQGAVGELIPPDLWCDRLVRGLDEMERLRGVGQKPNLSLFLRKLCPSAKPRHIRLFQIWMKELDHTEELKEDLATSRRLQEYFESFQVASYVARPVLPARVRQELLEEYESLAFNTLQASVTRDAFRKRFYDGGSRVTQAGVYRQEDYVAAMCPTEFRHKEGLQVAKVEEALSRKEALFAKNGEAAATRRKFIKPSVPDHQWDLWNEAFDSFSSAESSREGPWKETIVAFLARSEPRP
ncbi:hypothetical protein AK812_SmicGene5404 [Symbiodinium microadriaticum]|uniref:Uncharacterized protein n=1 Tax=Symbiodinium microadriaticum TaxID=2951 RepID=A0A1Q9ETW6_SYMMI|nr:hypothetical protein AK812_SmicGene5404 [Symbiodinium microadriaticum]